VGGHFENEVDLSAVTLAMIAGGMGRRMGVPKAWLRVGNESILKWMHRRLDWPGPTMLVTAPATAHPPDAAAFDQHCIDPVDNLGPMRGILTALENSLTERVAIVTVDMPLIGRRELTWLISTLNAAPQSQGVMCRVMRGTTRVIEPFPSIFRTTASPLIATRLASDHRSVQALGDDMCMLTADCPGDWPDNVWTNLNDPTQFATFESALDQSNEKLA
jgi:molybdenum cofactor guanylyltransferase